MKFLRVHKDGEDSLLNIDFIGLITKGKGKADFLIISRNENLNGLYEIYGKKGMKINKLSKIRLLIERRE